MKSINSKLLPLSAALALGLGFASQANATVYALSYNNIENFFIASGYMTGADPLVNFVVDTTVVSFGLVDSRSSSQASLNGASASNTDLGHALPDALPSQIGVVKLNNDMTPVGQVGGPYARGDAQVISEQALPATPAAAWNIAESYIPSGSSVGSAQGDNLSFTNFTVPLTVIAPAQIRFTGFADSYMQVFVSAGLLPGSFATAELTANITIQSILTGQNVFSWAPDGVASNATGGVDFSDPANMNFTMSRNSATAGTTTYDPTGDASVGAQLAPGLFYGALTNILASGDYMLNIQLREKVDTKNVPEPASLALLGIGLMGMGVIGIRRRRA